MELLRTTLEAEVTLKTIRTSSSEHKDEILKLAAEIRSNYRTLIITDTTLCQSKDLNAQLWKTCFYCDIEAFRQDIKRTVAVLDGSAEATNDRKTAQERLVVLMREFKLFLGKASSFYNDLLLQLENRMQECKRKSKWSLDKDYETLCFSAHRCLLYLGDISRYWEMHAESKQKNWQMVEKCYYKALRFMWTSGHAHNQLAVTAVYSNADITALFHYCFSIQIKNSFLTGSTNLHLFFKKNLRAINDDPASGRSSSSARDLKYMLKSACTVFIRLHGILFDASVRHERCLVQEDSVDRSDLFAKNVELDNAGLAEFRDLLPSVLDRLSHLIVHGQLGESVLLKIVAISIFSAQRYVVEGVGDDDTVASGNGIRTSAGSYSLIFLFSLINRISLLADRYRKLATVLMTPIVIFSEWVIQHQSVLHQTQCPSALLPDKGSASDGSFDTCGAKSYGSWFKSAPVDIVQLENRSRSGMRTSMVALANILDPQRSVTNALLSQANNISTSAGMIDIPDTNTTVNCSVGELYNNRLSYLMPSPIKEFIELRGFLPLADRIEGYYARYCFKDYYTIVPLDSFKAKNVRLFLLRQFVDMILSQVSSAPPQAQSSGDFNQSRLKTHSKSSDSGKRRYPPGTSSAPGTPLNRVSHQSTLAGSSGPEKRVGSSSSRLEGESMSKGSRRRRREEVANTISPAVNTGTEEPPGQPRGRKRRPSDDDVVSSTDQSRDDGEASDAEDQAQMDIEMVDRVEGCESEKNLNLAMIPNNTGIVESVPNDIDGEDDDDDEDEIIVFKPAFSRYVDPPEQPLLRTAVNARSTEHLGATEADLSMDEYPGSAVPMPVDWMGNATPQKFCGVPSELSWSFTSGGNPHNLVNGNGRSGIFETFGLLNELPIDASSVQEKTFSGAIKSSLSDPCLRSNNFKESDTEHGMLAENLPRKEAYSDLFLEQPIGDNDDLLRMTQKQGKSVAPPGFEGFLKPEESIIPQSNGTKHQTAPPGLEKSHGLYSSSSWAAQTSSP